MAVTIPPLQSQTGVNEITITPKDANDFGDYVCTARNFLGSTQQITTIEEIGKLYLYYLRTEERLNTVMECRGILKKSIKMFFFFYLFYLEKKTSPGMLGENITTVNISCFLRATLKKEI